MRSLKLYQDNPNRNGFGEKASAIFGGGGGGGGGDPILPPPISLISQMRGMGVLVERDKAKSFKMG